MRVLFWFLLLAGAAVAVALAARLTTGYALFVAPPFRVELSLNLLLVIVLASFVTGYVLLRIVRRALGLPEEVRRYRQRQQQERARARQDAAVVALLEGRFGRARQFAEEALAVPQSSGLSALLGARAAVATREFAAAETLLARADAAVPSLAVPRLMLEAEMKLEQGQPLEALGILATLRKEAGSHTAALRLELRALQAAGRYAEIPPLVDQLVKRKVYGVREGEFVRAAAHAQELAARARRGRLARLLVEARRCRAAHAEDRSRGGASFMALGGDRDAAEILARSLEREWNSDLVALYAECRPADGAAARTGRTLAHATRTTRPFLRAGRCASVRNCGARRRR
jgi:HemY protein